MKHRLFTITSVLSLALCAAVAGIWLDTLGHVVLWTVPSSNSQLSIRTDPGAISMYLTTYDEAVAADEGVQWYRAKRESTPRTTQFPKWHVLGAGFEHSKLDFGSTLGQAKYADQVMLRFPLWLPFCIFAILPTTIIARWVAVRLPRLWRTPAGRCAACGYDLRATPGRCPECGTTATKKVEATT